MNARDVQKQNIIEEHSHTQMERYFSPFSDCFQFLSLFRASKKDDWEMNDEVYANLEDRVQHYHFEGYADCDMDPELELPYDDTDRISATGTGVVTEKFTFDGVKYKARFKSDFVYGRYIVEDVSNTIEMQLLNDAEETLEEYHSIDEAERSKFLRVFCELADNFAMTYDALVEPLKVNDFQEGYALFLSDDYDIEIN